MMRHKIMIVDDDPDLVHLLVARTESFGFECHGFTSIDTALLALKVIKPDLIILSLEFAQNNGTLFLGNIQNYMGNGEKAPPVIVLNNEHDHQFSDYAFDLGTNVFHSKPYNLCTLSNMLTDYLPNDECTGETNPTLEDHQY